MESTNEKTLFEVAEIQLSYKSKVKASLRPKVTSSRDCYEVLKKYWDDNKIEFVKQFKVLLLNRAHRVIGLHEVSTGTTTHTVVDSRLIFVEAIKQTHLFIFVGFACQAQGRSIKFSSLRIAAIDSK
jgi:DNA repair protein RadC